MAWEKDPGRDERSGRPTLGSPVLINMRASSQARWDGQIYNATNGQTYKANVRMVGENTLRVQGCVLGGVFCGGQRWTRVANGSGTGRGAQSEVCARVSNSRSPTSGVDLTFATHLAASATRMSNPNSTSSLYLLVVL